MPSISAYYPTKLGPNISHLTEQEGILYSAKVDEVYDNLFRMRFIKAMDGV